jgi:hypothetical protein
MRFSNRKQQKFRMRRRAVKSRRTTRAAARSREMRDFIHVSRGAYLWGTRLDLVG